MIKSLIVACFTKFYFFSGPHTFCNEGCSRLTSVGKEMNGVETKLTNPDADGNGEVSYLYMKLVLCIIFL